MLCFISSSCVVSSGRSLFHRPGCPATLFRNHHPGGVYRGNALVKTKHTADVINGLSSCSAISSALGSWSSLWETRVRFAGKRSAPLRCESANDSTGLVHNRPFDRLANPPGCYVEKRKPRSGSNFSTARISPGCPLRSGPATPDHDCHNGGHFYHQTQVTLDHPAAGGNISRSARRAK